MSMKKTMTLVKREFKTKVLNRSFVIGTLLGPIFIIGIYYIPAFFRGQGSDTPMVIQAVDHSQALEAELPTLLDDILLDNGQPRYLLSTISPADYQENPEAYHESLEEGYIDGLWVISKDIMTNGEISYISAGTVSRSDIRLLQERISAKINQKRLADAGLDMTEIAALTAPIRLKTMKLADGKVDENSEANAFASWIFLTILYMTILAYGASVMRGVLEEKTSHIMEVLLSSGNSFQLMMGKLLGVGSVGLTQYLLWAAIALGSYYAIGAMDQSALAGIQLPASSFFFFILFFLLGYFQFSTLYAAVGAMCATQEDAQSLSTPVTLFIILPFLIAISLEPASEMARWLSMLPFFAPMVMFMRIEQANPPLWEILLAIGINVLAILFFTWVAAKIYRVASLMYGKRPSFGQVWRWIRYQ